MAAVEAVPAVPAAPADRAGSGDLPPITRMLSSQRPPPSPFESVPAAGPSAAAAPAAAAPVQPAAAAAAPANGGSGGRGHRLLPTKSALKISKDPEAPAAGRPTAPQRGLTWADTHGQDIHHVQEYQPSDHGSESFSNRALSCNCSLM